MSREERGCQDGGKPKLSESKLLEPKPSQDSGSAHSTVMFADASATKPLSPVHLNAMVPLSVATV